MIGGSVDFPGTGRNVSLVGVVLALYALDAGLLVLFAGALGRIQARRLPLARSAALGTRP